MSIFNSDNLKVPEEYWYYYLYNNKYDHEK